MREIVIGVLVLGMAAVAGCERRPAPAAAVPAPVAAPVAQSVAATAKENEKAELGLKFWRIKGCNACHTLDGSKSIGSSAAGLWGKPLKQADGTERTVDAAFIRESILDPSKTITAGYKNQMMSFTGRITEEELETLIGLYAWLKDGPKKSGG